MCDSKLLNYLKVNHHLSNDYPWIIHNHPLLLATRPYESTRGYWIYWMLFVHVNPTADSPPATSVDVIPKGDLHVNGRPSACGMVGHIFPQMPHTTVLWYGRFLQGRIWRMGFVHLVFLHSFLRYIAIWPNQLKFSGICFPTLPKNGTTFGPKKHQQKHMVTLISMAAGIVWWKASPSPAGEVVLLVLFAHALVQHPGVSHLKPEPSRRAASSGRCLKFMNRRPSLEAVGEHGCTGNLTKR